MEVRFADDRLRRLESDPGFRAREFGDDVVRSFRKKIQFIRAAVDERDLYRMKSLHFEKLKGDRAHQRSIRLNEQWRLILELAKEAGGKVVMVVSVEDYH
ncbi:MAG: type II toxin-antitoxin system RelE/ParE family toxin [Phycisphaeraceae bacterium]|nr:type II toxin-antitoxin system RelE/ParE family toxin [Phycisphaeraceae bacterium]